MNEYGWMVVDMIKKTLGMVVGCCGSITLRKLLNKKVWQVHGPCG